MNVTTETDPTRSGYERLELDLFIRGFRLEPGHVTDADRGLSAACDVYFLEALRDGTEPVLDSDRGYDGDRGYGRTYLVAKVKMTLYKPIFRCIRTPSGEP